jgi:methylaspartate mutase sigma subunit
MSRGRVVIGVIGDDIHIVGNRIMQLALEECGFTVYNLRTCNRPARFVQAALEVNAHAVFVSSLNGEGEYWCSDFRKDFSAVGLNNILLYVGGNIVVGKRSQEEVIALFKGFGFDRVYHQPSDIRVAIRQLEEDLKHGQAKREGETAGN